MMLADARPLSALNYIIRDLIYRYTLLRLPEQQHCDVCCTLIAFAGSGKPSSGSSLCNRPCLAIALRKAVHLLQRNTTRRNAMHLLQLVSLALLQHAAALQLTTSQHRRIAPLAAAPVCELQDDGPELDTNAAATLARAGLNTPAADALVSRGIDAEADGETLEALEAYEGAVELDPNHPNALFRLGALNVQFGLTEDARDLFHRALDADPDHSAAAACLHLLQDVDATALDAQHAASIEAARAEDDAVEEEVELVPVEVARRSAVKRIPRFLSDAEIDELTATAASVEADVGQNAPASGG